jgi:hypothetical protein
MPVAKDQRICTEEEIQNTKKYGGKQAQVQALFPSASLQQAKAYHG